MFCLKTLGFTEPMTWEMALVHTVRAKTWHIGQGCDIKCFGPLASTKLFVLLVGFGSCNLLYKINKSSAAGVHSVLVVNMPISLTTRSLFGQAFKPQGIMQGYVSTGWSSGLRLMFWK